MRPQARKFRRRTIILHEDLSRFLWKFAEIIRQSPIQTEPTLCASRKGSKKIGSKPIQVGQGDRPKWINIKRILLPKSDESLTRRLSGALPRSIVVVDLLHPIVVRRVTEETKDGETTERIVLVAGAHRLEAMKRVRKEKILCILWMGMKLRLN